MSSANYATRVTLSNPRRAAEREYHHGAGGYAGPSVVARLLLNALGILPASNTYDDVRFSSGNSGVVAAGERESGSRISRSRAPWPDGHAPSGARRGRGGFRPTPAEWTARVDSLVGVAIAISRDRGRRPCPSAGMR